MYLLQYIRSTFFKHIHRILYCCILNQIYEPQSLTLKSSLQSSPAGRTLTIPKVRNRVRRAYLFAQCGMYVCSFLLIYDPFFFSSMLLLLLIYAPFCFSSMHLSSHLCSFLLPIYAPFFFSSMLFSSSHLCFSSSHISSFLLLLYDHSFFSSMLLSRTNCVQTPPNDALRTVQYELHADT